MIIKDVICQNVKCEAIEYDSLGEFYKYICDTPINEAFRWESLSSVVNGKDFTGTDSFEQAVELFKNGWEDMANKLTKKLKVIENEIKPSTRAKMTYDVQGFQCSVPRYVNGIPTSMICKKNFPIKQKVVTVTKSIDYSGSVDQSTIIEESIKALQIVKKLESQGLRVNLNIIIGTSSGKDGFFVKIRLKNANERLNISKLAFPLVNPSMLRRLLFRFMEVYPKITSKFVRGYGTPATSAQLREVCAREYLLPSVIRKSMDKINNIDDLEGLD